MSVVLAVAGLGLGKVPTAAIKLHILNENALGLFLQYIGVPMDAAVPEMQVGNIQVRDGMTWDGIGWHGMGWDAMAWHGMGVCVRAHARSCRQLCAGVWQAYT